MGVVAVYQVNYSFYVFFKYTSNHL